MLSQQTQWGDGIDRLEEDLRDNLGECVSAGGGSRGEVGDPLVLYRQTLTGKHPEREWEAGARSSRTGL